MTAEDKMEILKSEYKGILLIGNENGAIRYMDSLVGVDSFDRAVYDYDRLVECFMKADNITYEEAREWVDYNVIRSLPYMGERAPVIIYTSFDGLEF